MCDILYKTVFFSMLFSIICEKCGCDLILFFHFSLQRVLCLLFFLSDQLFIFGLFLRRLWPDSTNNVGCGASFFNPVRSGAEVLCWSQASLSRPSVDTSLRRMCIGVSYELETVNIPPTIRLNFVTQELFLGNKLFIIIIIYDKTPVDCLI